MNAPFLVGRKSAPASRTVISSHRFRSEPAREKASATARYRSRLPQLDGGLFLTDGGIETSLIFHDRLDLPHFAAFHLLKGADGREALRRYYARYAEIACREGAGFILESPTWRASADWGRKLGYAPAALAEANRAAIELMSELRTAFETKRTRIVISGCLGPRGDGYDPGRVMSADQAETYHAVQIRAFAKAAADMVTAITMTSTSESIGIVRAARAASMPVAVSFTLETDGRLPTGQSLGAAIVEVDAATGRYPAYYMIDCAHPSHFANTLAGGPWVQRVRGLRANASRRSHQELNDSPDLDEGSPVELAIEYAGLRRRHPQINVLGGGRGTDHRHVEQISYACRMAIAA